MSEPKPVHIAWGDERNFPIVFMTGDPYRAQYIAEYLLKDSKKISDVRGQFGYSGFCNGVKVMVLSAGMGQASWEIYAMELIKFFGAKVLIRLGTCGSYWDSLPVGEIIIGKQAYSDANAFKKRYKQVTDVTEPDPDLFRYAVSAARNLNISFREGTILATDHFYPRKGQENDWLQWKSIGIDVVEMESNMLYEVAKENNVKALTILTVSDNLSTGKFMTTEERQHCPDKMFSIARGIVQRISL